MTERRIYSPLRQSLDSPFRRLMGEGKNDVTIKSVKDPNQRRCCAEIQTYVGGWPRYNQCDAPGKFIEGDDAWCGKHNEAAFDRREAKRKERLDRERAQFDAKWERQRAAGRALIEVDTLREALEEIANGTNDARGVARKALGLEQSTDEESY